MDRSYEAYCLADPLFYDAPERIHSERLEFALATGPVPLGWTRYPLGDWLVYRPVGVPLRPQGWKIHASACLHNAEEILATVWDYCIPRRIAFKFRSGRHTLLLANGKYADRGASGKFITVYPGDDSEFRRILEELGDALDGQSGPYILSDLRWRDGPLYVRYGQFVERLWLSPSGELESAIEDPSGQLVPDRREPTFRVPPWLALPDFLLPHLEARNSTKLDDIPYRIERALHFSNGGGLYAGEDLRTGERVVLKEARPYAGLDMTGTDAVTRLRREGEILQRLAGIDEVPGFRDSFTLGEHLFLVQEFVEGERLYSELVARYPLLAQEPDEWAVADYTTWALDVDVRIERAVAAIHERGIIMGDFHAHNVLIRPDGRIVLIDFEVAAHINEGRRPSLGGAGFRAPQDRTGFEIDRYSLACLRLFLFLPLTNLLDLDRAKAHQYAAEIEDLFPVPREFLAEAVETITAGEADKHGLDASSHGMSKLIPDGAGWERARRSVSQAILLSATPDREDRLFPGDIMQFETGGMNFAYGAAGVLYALEMTGAGRYRQYEEWLVARATHPEPGFRLGFYDGLHGVAYVLDLLGHRVEALKLLDMCSDELRGRWDQLGLDLLGGLAGIGLNLAHFADATGDPVLRDTALGVADAVAQRMGDEDSVPTTSGGEHPYAGLLHGSSGPALLFVRLYEQTGDAAWLDLAATALRQDLRRCVKRDDGSLEVDEGWRTMPYLQEGSVGVGMVLEDYLAHREDERFASDAAAIRLTAGGQFYLEPGLFHGRAGMILHLSRAHAPGTAGDDPVVGRHVRRLAWHALTYKGHLAFPGEEMMRLSMDLATGSAGVLLALGSALHPEPVHLPFLPRLRMEDDVNEPRLLALERR